MNRKSFLEPGIDVEAGNRYGCFPEIASLNLVKDSI